MILRQFLLGTGAAGVLSVLCCFVPANAQSQDLSEQFMTGAEPIDDAEYESLPKTARYRAFLPKQVDLAPLFPKPGNQGRQPSCVAWATTYAAQSFLIAESAAARNPPADPMSPAYVYNRLRKPGSACDRPVRIVDALRLLQSEGTVTLADFPDDVTRCEIAAPQALVGKAKANRLTQWQAIARTRKAGSSRVVLDDIKGALSRNEPVVFAMPAMPDFNALKGETIYRHETPEKTNWHAMAAIGYDEARQAFRIVNSWGDYWADGGYAWIDYQTFALLVGEAYAMKMERPRLAVVVQSQTLKPIDPSATFRELVSGLTCSKVSYSEMGGRLTVTGFGGNLTELGELRQFAANLDRRFEWRVQHHPWPQCEAELTLQDALGQEEVTLSILTERGDIKRGDPIIMRQGEIFGLAVTSSKTKPWLTLVYLQADGSAVTLYNARADGKSVRLGLAGKKKNRFQVATPFGNEMVIALSSDRPLLEPGESQLETERQFLSNLRAVISPPKNKGIAASVVRLTTSP